MKEDNFTKIMDTILKSNLHKRGNPGSSTFGVVYFDVGHNQPYQMTDPEYKLMNDYIELKAESYTIFIELESIVSIYVRE